ncbi:MAG: hypothetical protein WBD55_06270 [Dehalococcoidia bacterium]
MRLTARLERLERRLLPLDELPWPVVVVAGPKEEDKPTVFEIVQARLERSWPRGIIHAYITSGDVAAWREGRKEEAIAGINHRFSAGRQD